MRYKTQLFQFSSGERNALLVDENGMPLFYQNLFATLNHRNAGDSVNTIIACLNNLKYLQLICENLGVDLEQRFLNGKLLGRTEIEQIAYWARKTAVALEETAAVTSAVNVKALPKRLELSRFTVTVDDNLVQPMTAYNRLSDFSKYVVWLANEIAPADSKSQISTMEATLLSHRPAKRSGLNDPNHLRGLSQEQVRRLVDVVRPESCENPWRNTAVRCRNQMIVNLLVETGCRKSELLNLKVTDFESGSTTIPIRRSHDDSNDPRIRQPLVKTHGRDVDISPDAFALVEKYILEHRYKIPGAGKTPFLVLSHQAGVQVAAPLSISALDKIFVQLSDQTGFDANPHAFRHAWNDDFSEAAEEAIVEGEMTEGEAEELRSYLMGWTENSGTAATYTKRYTRKRAMLFSLELQAKRRYVPSVSAKSGEES